LQFPDNVQSLLDAARIWQILFFGNENSAFFKERRQVRNQSQISQKKLQFCVLNFTQSKNS
jgi:hypothetical protein